MQNIKIPQEHSLITSPSSAKHNKKINTYGNLLSIFRSSYILHKHANYWFGGILATVQSINPNQQLVDDLTIEQHGEICIIMNQTMTAILKFYEQQKINYYSIENIENTVSSLSSQLPHSVFRLLSIYKKIIDQTSFANSLIGSIRRINYLNNLAVFSLRLKHYTITMQCFQEIIKIYKNGNIQSSHQSLLISYSNYISLLKKTQKNNIKGLQMCKYDFAIVFQKIMKKIRSYGNYMNTLELMIAIYSQHTQDLSKYQYQTQLTDLILKYVPNSNKIWKKVKNITFLYSMFQQKIAKKIKIYIHLKKYQFQFFIQARPQNYSISKQQKINKLQQMLSRGIQMLIEQKTITSSTLNKYERLQKLNQTISQNLQFQKQSFLNKTIEIQRSKRDSQIKIDSSLKNEMQNNRYTPAIQKNNLKQKKQFESQIQYSGTKKLQSLVSSIKKGNLDLSNLKKGEQQQQQNFSSLNSINLTSTIPNKKYQTLSKVRSRISSNIRSSVLKNSKPIHSHQHQVTFKYNSILLIFTNQGILFTDITKTSNRYIDWNGVSYLCTKMTTTAVFSQYFKCPIYTFYDLARALCQYLSRTQTGSIKLSPNPQAILSINNNLIKLYRQQGNYVKITLMNRYKVQYIVGFIDCKLQQYDHYFKTLHDNQYVSQTNRLLCTLQQDERQNIYYLNLIKKQSQATGQQLERILTTQIIQDCITVNSSHYDYKFIYLLKNNVNLLFQFKIKSFQGDDFLSLNIRNLHNSSKMGQISIDQHQKNVLRKMVIPIHQVKSYIPRSHNQTLKAYLKQNGRLITSFFTDIKIVDEGIQTNFNVFIHAKASGMIPYGKYYSPISIQLIGSQKKISGLLFRFYELAFADQKICLFLSPYENFLQNFWNLQKEQRNQLFRKKFLINGSVQQSYNWVKNKGYFGKIMNLMQYLQTNNLII